jgi:hypothetical protein
MVTPCFATLSPLLPWDNGAGRCYSVTSRAGGGCLAGRGAFCEARKQGILLTEPSSSNWEKVVTKLPGNMYLLHL